MKFDIKKIDKFLMNADKNVKQDAKQLAKTVIKTAVKRKIEEKIGEKVLWQILLYTAPFWLPFIAIFLLILLTLFVVLMASSSNNVTVEMEPFPKNISPGSGIPQMFRHDITRASEMFSVPIQYLAGETTTESGWNPNAYANYGGSHAMGLMQFEPETWSGWSDPITTPSSPDTNQNNITKYRGYGVDANGLWAPTGTSAFAAGTDAYTNLQCRNNGYVGCTLYSSPFDPADALASGAHYLSSLYKNNVDWAAASASYYGGADAEAYVKKVMTATYEYVANTSPITRGKNKNKVYFPLGLSMYHEQYVKHRGWYIEPIQSRRYFLTDEYAASMPLFMPTNNGTVLWKTKNGMTTITIPIKKNVNWILTMSASRGMKWAYPKKVSKWQNIPSGTLLGFINMSSGVKENIPLSGLEGIGMNQYNDFDPATFGTVVYPAPPPPTVYVP